MKKSGLWNFLDDIQATAEQAHDLLNFRSIGQESFECYVSKLIGSPSTNTPNSRRAPYQEDYPLPLEASM